MHSAHGLEVGPGDKRSLSADLLRAKQYFFDLCLTQPFDVEKGSLGRHVYGLSCVKTGFLELFDITSAHPLVGQLVNLQPLALLSGTTVRVAGGGSKNKAQDTEERRRSRPSSTRQRPLQHTGPLAGASASPPSGVVLVAACKAPGDSRCVLAECGPDPLAEELTAGPIHIC